MKSITSFADKAKRRAGSENWADRLAKKAMIKLLQNIEVGHLTIEDDGEVYSFGQPSKDLDIIAHISVNHISAYRAVLFGGTVGSGEAYIDNTWWSPDLTQVIRLMVANMAMLQKMDSRWSAFSGAINRFLLRFSSNTKDGSKRNISAHYDLSNDFFALFLDKSMQYSSGIYPHASSSLESASFNKLERVCKQLNLSSNDHLLEIGTGWGGLAIHAAKRFGCRVTTVTISQKQFEYARDWVEQEGLRSLVDVQLKDYRDIRGKFDKLVSIEMIEAVGHQFYKNYFSRCSQFLRPKGLMLIQAITVPDQRYDYAKNRADFIKKYIFPGGCLPSIEVIAKNIRAYTDMQIVSLDDITLHYAKTLADWKNEFFKKMDQVADQGFSDQFVRMWDFYLSYCEGGFRERVIGTSQIVFAKPANRDLPAI